jgi:hypothetical protein
VDKSKVKQHVHTHARIWVLCLTFLLGEMFANTHHTELV